MRYILQSKLTHIILLFFLFPLFHCNRDSKELEIDQLKHQLSRYKETSKKNAIFIEKLEEEYLSIQKTLDSVKLSDSLLKGSNTKNSLSAIKKIKILELALQKSQVKIASLTKELDRYSNATISKAGQIIIDQLQRQVDQLKEELAIVLEENADLKHNLGITTANLNQVNQNLEETKALSEIQRAKFLDSLDEKSQKNNQLEEQLNASKKELEKAEVEKIFKEGKAYFESLNLLIDPQKGKIKNNDRKEATRLAEAAILKFKEALQSGHKEAQHYLHTLNYNSVYQPLLRKRPTN